MRTKIKPEPETNLDWARGEGQKVGVSIMRGEITAVDGAYLIWGIRSNCRWDARLVETMEAMAWLTDSLEVEFRMAMNKIVVEQQGWTS